MSAVTARLSLWSVLSVCSLSTPLTSLDSPRAESPTRVGVGVRASSPCVGCMVGWCSSVFHVPHYHKRKIVIDGQ